jgi:hypothetical protein
MNIAVDKPGAERQRRRLQFGLRSFLVGITLFAVLLGLGSMALWWIGRAGIRIHQRAVTRELADWGAEYAQIQDDQDAFRAIGMLRYIERYYVPGEGYRSDSATEEALQATRRQAMDEIIASLECYTGEHFGNDLDRWEAWRDRSTSATQSSHTRIP